MIEEHAPDVVMLDVQMPGLTGFEVARRLLRAGIESQFVFVTAFDRHAIEAFEVNAVDYLLKPVEAGRLSTARRAGPPPDAVGPGRGQARPNGGTGAPVAAPVASARDAAISWPSRSATGSC